MKKVKKYKYIIVIIIITLMMIFKISSVSQADYKYTKDKDGNVINLGRMVENSRISVSQAIKYKKWWITYNDYTPNTNKGNIYCVEEGDFLYSKGASYNVTNIIHFDGLRAGGHIKNGSVESPEYAINGKIAYLLEEAKTIENRKKLIWKFMPDWQNVMIEDKVFEKDVIKFGMKSEDITLTKDQKVIADAADKYAKEYDKKGWASIKLNITDMSVVCEKIDGQVYYKIGPIKCKFSESLESIKVKNQNGKKVELSFIKQDKEKVSVSNIKNNGELYIYIPYNSENKSVTITFTTKKPIFKNYTAEVVLLRSGPQSWQNLIAVESDVKSSKGVERTRIYQQHKINRKFKNTKS